MHPTTPSLCTSLKLFHLLYYRPQSSSLTPLIGIGLNDTGLAVFIHRVNSHASKTAKIIKRGYYTPSRRLFVNVMLSNTPFYDFCGFWCVAVNTGDKLQFLSFIFTVLLLITVNFISHRLGRAIMNKHNKFMLKSMQMLLRYHDFSGFLHCVSKKKRQWRSTL